MTASTHVPGQYLGYSQQATRVMAYLLSSPNDARVSLEVLDDSAVHFSDGSSLAEQSKSALDHNPVANSSIDFWKTVSNWLSAHSDGELPVNSTRYVLYINAPFPSDIPLKFSEANSLETAQAAISYTEEWFKDKLKAKKAKSGTESPHLSVADEYANSALTFDRSVLLQLVCNFSLEFGTGDAQADLVPLVKGVRRSLRTNVIRYMQGWLKERIDTLLAGNEKAIISVGDFNDELSSYNRSIDVATALSSNAPEPTKQQIEAEFSRVFVQQLDVIDQSLDDKLRAIDHFLRAACDRTQWGVNFEINEASFKQFEGELEGFWDIARQRAALDVRSGDAKEMGLRTLLDCRACKQQLQGMVTPTHFIQGSYHRLADLMKVGWHPNYKVILGDNSGESK